MLGRNIWIKKNFRITKNKLISCTPGDDAKDLIFDGQDHEETTVVEGVELTAVRNSRIENNQLITTENVNTAVMDIESQTILTVQGNTITQTINMNVAGQESTVNYEFKKVDNSKCGKCEPIKKNNTGLIIGMVILIIILIVLFLLYKKRKNNSKLGEQSAIVPV